MLPELLTAEYTTTSRRVVQYLEKIMWYDSECIEVWKVQGYVEKMTVSTHTTKLLHTATFPLEPGRSNLVSSGYSV